MNIGAKILLANVPTMVCAVVGGLLADRGHPWFAGALLLLAFTLAHSVTMREGSK